MDVLTAAPYNLEYDQLIIAKVRAVNSFGDSDWSELNDEGVMVRSVPFQMPTMETIYTITTQIQISFA
jgi:hypothetical protein